MAQERVPYSWVGRQVEALIIQPEGTTRRGGQISYSSKLSAWGERGRLEDVTDHGIVATFEEEEGEPPASAFYPWGAVLQLRLRE